MSDSDVIDAISDGKYDLSELGDGTSVLTSLTDSKIVTLNKLATAVIKALLESKTEDRTETLDNLAVKFASQSDVSTIRVRNDISVFLEKLPEQLIQGKR